MLYDQMGLIIVLYNSILVLTLREGGKERAIAIDKFPFV